MALGQSLWVGADDDLVLSAADARAAMAGLLAKSTGSSPLTVRTGVLYNGRVSSLLGATSGLSVNVLPLHFVSSKGDSNGPYIGTIKTTTAVTVPAAPALGNKRIDVLWARQKDKNALVSADTSTVAELGVTTGTAGSDPSEPSIPSDATEIGTITWDSTSTVATATNAAQCTLTVTCQWTALHGEPIPVRTADDRATLTPYNGMRVLRLDKNSRIETHDGTGWRTEVFGNTSVTVNGTGDFTIPAATTGLTTVLWASVGNGNGGVATGARENVTVARNVPFNTTPGAITGRVVVAETHTYLPSGTAVEIDWLAKGYS